MAQAGKRAVAGLISRLQASDGLESECTLIGNLLDVELAPIDSTRIADLHISPDLAEKGASVKYPIAYVYCERVVNSLSEKFRTFSGKADLNIEIRVSHDHADELQTQVQTYVEAVTNVLDRARGSWAAGLFYTGGYEIVFSPVKRGGRNYLQTARVKLEVHISAD